MIHNIDDIYEEYTAEATAVKSTYDSGLIIIKLFVDEDFTSAPYGRVRVKQTINSEHS